MKISQDTVPLEAPVGDDDGDSVLADFVADEESVSPETLAGRRILKDHLNEIIDDLSTREQKILEMFSGNFGNKADAEKRAKAEADKKIKQSEIERLENSLERHRKEEETLRKEEEEYRKLEAYYREELGVQEGNGIGAEGVDLEVKKEGDGY